MKTVTVEQMRNLDARTINEAGIPGTVLMKNAGVGAAEYIANYIASVYSGHVKRFVILAGKGNNGGDGYVVADYLAKNYDLEVIVNSVCSLDDLQGDASYYADIAENSVTVIEKETPIFRKGDIVIDALLGT